MRNKIRDAFNQVHAESELKDKTIESVYNQINKKKHHMRFMPNRRYSLIFSAMLICLCVGLGGHHLYFTEVFALSVDVNPSIELGINRFDKVISVQGYNEEGEAIASSLEIKHTHYKDAVEGITEEERRCGYLAAEEDVSIAIVCRQEKKYEEIKDCISNSKVSTEQNVIIQKCQPQTIYEAHGNEMSFGKYELYLQLQTVSPEIAVEEVKTMTVKEIATILVDSSDTQKPATEMTGNSENQTGTDSDATTASQPDQTTSPSADSTTTTPETSTEKQPESTSSDTSTKKPVSGNDTTTTSGTTTTKPETNTMQSGVDSSNITTEKPNNQTDTVKPEETKPAEDATVEKDTTVNAGQINSTTVQL